jgi:GT2 family glycosyltransferase
LVPKRDLVDCYDKLISLQYDFAYPHNGEFYDIPEKLVEKLNSDLNTPIDINACTFFAPASHGGCVMFRRDVFAQGGKLNPNFKDVGYDDDEINVRFLKLGYKKYRSNSPLMHMTHFRGESTFNHSKHVGSNAQECGKVDSMTVEQLRDYIKGWHANS